MASTERSLYHDTRNTKADRNQFDRGSVPAGQLPVHHELAPGIRLDRLGAMTHKISNSFTALNLSNTDFTWILVIKDHQDDWLDKVKEALRPTLERYRKTLGLSPTSLAVINEEMAKKKGLII